MPSLNTDGVWIVMPAYNEGRRIGATLQTLEQFHPRVAVVDDGSHDNTYDIACGHPVHALRHAINLGQGAALQTALDYALLQGAEFIVSFDSDGQHSVHDIAKLLEPLRAGVADFTLGSRFLGSTVGITWNRWLVLKLGVLFTRVFSRIRVTDTHNGLRAMTRHGAEQIQITQNRMAHASEILDQIQQTGLKYVEVPVTITYTEETFAKGQSSWNALKIVGQLLLGRITR